MADEIKISKILDMIPHRHPMVFVDKMEECVSGKSGVGIKNIAYNELYFVGHFPGEPIFPGVLILECMAQTAAVVMSPLGNNEGAENDKAVVQPKYLAKANKLKFSAPVFPGDQLVTEISVIKNMGRMVMVAATSKVNGKVVASAELSLAG